MTHAKQIKLWQAFWLVFIFGIVVALGVGYLLLVLYFLLAEYTQLVSLDEHVGLKLLLTGPVRSSFTWACCTCSYYFLCSPVPWGEFNLLIGCKSVVSLFDWSALVGIAGGVIGCYFAIRNTHGPKERQFMVRLCIGMVLLLALLLGSVFYVGYPAAAWIMAPFFGILLPLFIYFGNKKQQQIRKAEANSQDK